MLRGLLVLFAFTLTSTSLAQRERAREPAALPAAPPAASPYTLKVRDGMRLSVSGDQAGAIAAFREAVQLDAASPEAFYLMGAARRALGRLEEALDDFRTAARLSEETDDQRGRARALQGIAETLERMTGRASETRDAWNAFVQFADSHRSAANAEVGRARIQALDAVVQQDEAYGPVRERIAERERPARPRRRANQAGSAQP